MRFFPKTELPRDAVPFQVGHLWKRSETTERILRVARNTHRELRCKNYSKSFSSNFLAEADGGLRLAAGLGLGLRGLGVLRDFLLELLHLALASKLPFRPSTNIKRQVLKMSKYVKTVVCY